MYFNIVSTKLILSPYKVNAKFLHREKCLWLTDEIKNAKLFQLSNAYTSCLN